MLTDLRLLLLQNDDRQFISSNINSKDTERLCAWFKGELEPALDAFLWCASSGEESFKTPEQDRIFADGAARLNVSADTLLGLFNKREELYYTGSRISKKDSDGKGRFIVLEGLDGSGKTTHIKLLSDKLSAEGNTVYATAEPTQTSVGGLIRDTLGGFHGRDASELAALFCADRINHNTNPKNGIMGFINRGVDVICDRYYYSSMAYQGIDSDLNWVAGMNLNCPGILKPDGCIFLDLSTEICVKRITSNRLTSEIFETTDMIRKVKRRFSDVFRMLNKTDNIYIVNANRPIELVAAEIYSIVKDIK